MRLKLMLGACLATALLLIAVLPTPAAAIGGGAPPEIPPKCLGNEQTDAFCLNNICNAAAAQAKVRSGSCAEFACEMVGTGQGHSCYEVLCQDVPALYGSYVVPGTAAVATLLGTIPGLPPVVKRVLLRVAVLCDPVTGGGYPGTGCPEVARTQFGRVGAHVTVGVDPTTGAASVNHCAWATSSFAGPTGVHHTNTLRVTSSPTDAIEAGRVTVSTGYTYASYVITN